ncbi:nitroreductase family protein [Candidatus Woesearchaeota archaeon]|nr:nitroreductase family protein [Candidatus Woesearchaeota archaeon]
MNKDFIDIIKGRKSVRRFTEKDVPDELVKEILQLGVYAPTSCNQQLWQFVVVKSKSVKEKLVSQCYSSTLIMRAPVVIVILYDGWSYKEAIQASSMAVQNILLAATYYGVGALAMNSYGADSKIKKVLNIPKRYEICCFVCLGYPEEIYKTTKPVLRRDVGEIIHNEGFKEFDNITYSYNPEKWSFGHLVEYQKYYCRKTFLGKEMDISNNFEKKLVRDAIQGKKGPILDIMSYDGAYLKEFPKERIICLDICQETSEYTKEAVRQNTLNQNVEYKIYEENKKSLHSTVPTITMLYKAERLSRKQLSNLFKQSRETLKEGGTMVIISRRSSLLFNLFYKTIIALFKDDIRKTGIYAFFGPYKPVKSKAIKRLLSDAGFRDITEKRYFLIPPFFDEALQMFLQYKKSEGSSYLHRKRHENKFTGMFSFLLRIQNSRKSCFGSISVFEAKNKKLSANRIYPKT